MPIVIAMVCGCAHPPPAIPTAPKPPVVRMPSCLDGPLLQGIDVSIYQGDIDWAAVKGANIDFAFIRASHGLDEDTRFAANWMRSREAGIVHGAYQFFRPAQDPIAQADLLLSKIGAVQPDDLPPVLDVEDAGGLPPSEVAKAVRVWVDHVNAAIGRPPIIYTSFYFWRDHVAFDFTSSRLWHAQYTTERCPRIAPPWVDWAIWQYSSTGHVAGISGNVDLDRWRGDRASLDAFLGAASR